MTPRQARTYKPPRDRREILFAALGVTTVLLFTIVMLFILKPSDESTPAPIPPISVPTTAPTDTTPTTVADPSATTVPSATDTTSAAPG